MILPIMAFGHPVLKKVADPITPNYPELASLIDDMWETMYAAHGVGLAAPQIGRSIRLFVVDAAPFADDESLEAEEAETLKSFKRVFINPVIVEDFGENCDFNEGCLSIPDIREDVSRPDGILMEYMDENFAEKEIRLSGLASRVVQHEYDHIEGILFTDKLGPLKKRLLKTKLTQISKGKINPDYKMRFPNKSNFH